LDLALETLRSAAAELYKASSYCNTYEVLGNTDDAITAIQQALAAPTVQEPKFWYDEEMGELYSPGDDRPDGCTPLYTTPPAAQPAHSLLAFAQNFLNDYQTEDGMQSMKHYAREAQAAIDNTTLPAAQRQHEDDK
jgi:hypothetical protein